MRLERKETENRLRGVREDHKRPVTVASLPGRGGRGCDKQAWGGRGVGGLQRVSQSCHHANREGRCYLFKPHLSHSCLCQRGHSQHAGQHPCLVGSPALAPLHVIPLEPSVVPQYLLTTGMMPVNSSDVQH